MTGGTRSIRKPATMTAARRDDIVRPTLRSGAGASPASTNAATSIARAHPSHASSSSTPRTWSMNRMDVSRPSTDPVTIAAASVDTVVSRVRMLPTVAPAPTLTLALMAMTFPTEACGPVMSSVPPTITASAARPSIVPSFWTTRTTLADASAGNVTGLRRPSVAPAPSTHVGVWAATAPEPAATAWPPAGWTRPRDVSRRYPPPIAAGSPATL